MCIRSWSASVPYRLFGQDIALSPAPGIHYYYVPMSERVQVTFATDHSSSAPPQSRLLTSSIAAAQLWNSFEVTAETLCREGLFREGSYRLFTPNGDGQFGYRKPHHKIQYRNL
jgi:hypothetical protein